MVYEFLSCKLTTENCQLITITEITFYTNLTFKLRPLETYNERRVAEDRRDCYWLYIVTDCSTTPQLQDPVKDPARFEWHEVTKVAHYSLSVSAITQPMHVRDDLKPYAGHKT